MAERFVWDKEKEYFIPVDGEGNNMSSNHSARGNPSQRGSGRGGRGNQGNRGGHSYHGSRGGASNLGSRDGGGSYDAPNSRRTSQSETGDGSYGSQYDEFRGGQSRMNYRQNSASNVNTADYRENRDKNRGGGHDRNRGRGDYQNMGQDQRRGQNEDGYRGGQNRGRGGNDYNRGGGGQGHREGQEYSDNYERQDGERGYSNDNRSRGGQRGNRGRGGQSDNRDRSGYSENYEGQNQSNERGYNNDTRGRGGPSGNRGRGEKSGNRGRGGQSENRDSPGYSDSFYDGQSQSNDRGYNNDNRGRGGQRGNRGRGGQSGNRDRSGYTENYEGQSQSNEREYKNYSGGRGGQKGNRGRGNLSQSKEMGSRQNLNREMGSMQNLNREMGSMQNLNREDPSDTPDKRRNREYSGGYNKGHYENNEGQRGPPGNRGPYRGNQGGHCGAPSQGRNSNAQDRQNYDEYNQRHDYGDVGPGFMYPPPPPPPPLFPPPMYPYFPPPGPGPAPNNLYNTQSSSTWSLNNDGVRPGNLSRSTSNPSVNNIGARPKQKPFQNRQDYRDVPQQQNYGNNRGGNISGGRTNSGNRFPRGRKRGRGGNQYRNKTVDSKTNVKENEEDCGEMEDNEENNQRQNNKSMSRKERSRQYFDRMRRGQRGRGSRMSWNKILSSVYKEIESRDRRSSFGSTISLTSEVSEINEGEKPQDNELKLDDLDTAKLQTLRNRLKRYRLRLQNLHKEDNTDRNKIEEFEKGISLLRDAIATRPKSEKPADSPHVDNKDLDVDEDDSEVEDKPHMKEEKIIRLPRKMNLSVGKKGNISFKPKLLKNKIKKKKLKVKGNVESSVESTEEEMEGDMSEDSQDKIEEIKKPSKGKPPRPKKKGPGKDNKDKNNDKGRIKESKLDDLMSKLDDLCKPNKLEDTHIIDQSKIAAKKVSCATEEKQRVKADKRPTGGLNFAFKPNEAYKEMKNSDIYSDNFNQGPRGYEGGSSPKNGPDVNDVFKFLVKHLGGSSMPDIIARESGLFLDGCDIDKWFIGYRKRFTMIERQGKITNVFVFNKDATYCLDYITKRSCDKPDCSRYHVCKDMLCGNCAFGDEQCRFSHDFLDENNRNLSISKRLGYNNIFTNEEIRFILMARFPHICMTWNENGKCEKLNCPSLHICQRFILGNCLENQSACSFSHDKLSEHNKPIIDAYRMGQWNDSLFRRMIYIMRSPKVRTSSTDDSDLLVGATGKTRTASLNEEEQRGVNSPNEVELEGAILDTLHTDIADQALPVQSRTRKQKNKSDVKKAKFTSSTADEVGFICETSIKPNGCSQQRCRLAHLEERMPYIWQLKIFGHWISFPHIEDIEKAFCDKIDHFSTELERDATVYKVHVVFKPAPHAIVSMDGQTDGQDILEVRRLSTRSYMEGTYKSDSYKTQWRWYFKTDGRQWEPFEPNMQLTLEQKYLAGQKIYLYPRENFKFRYECDLEAMTQVNLVTRKTREVLRRPIFVSRQHVDSGSFPEAMKAPPSFPPVPKRWFPWDMCNTFEFIKLSTESEDYKDVEASFFLTVDRQRYSIDEILLVQNPERWRAFCTEEESMQANLERSGREDAVVYKRNLFHGTSSLDVVRGIAINSFDSRVSGKNGTVYGEGAYFARDAKYSNSYTDSTGGEKFMFRATVLVGEYTLAKKEYKRPPSKPGKSHELFDSCVDRMDNPAIFVLFDRSKSYPEYLIVYHDNQPPLEPPRLRRVTLPPRSVSGDLPNSLTSMSQGSGQTNTPVRLTYPGSPQSPTSSSPHISQMTYPSHGASQTYPSAPLSYPSTISTSPTSPPARSPKKPDSCSIQ